MTHPILSLLKHFARGTLGALFICLWTAQGASVDDALLDRAFAQLQAYNWGQPADALLALDDAIAATHKDPAARRRLERRLVAVLQTNAPAAGRQMACRKLALVGSGAAVPELAALLTNEELSHMARFALERIPDATAAAALRDALPKTSARLKVGVINSLGVLADREAVPALSALLMETDASVAAAAASALGKIGTLPAVQALETFRTQAPVLLQAVVNDALVTGAEGLVRRGDRAEAARIFRGLFDREGGALRLAGFRGLVLAEPAGAPRLLVAALSGSQESLRCLAVNLLEDLPGEGALRPFLDSWASLPPGGQAALLEVARSRRDAGAHATVLAASASSEPAVRLAALRAVGAIGTEKDAVMLARQASASTGAEREAARVALAALPGRSASQTLAALVPEAPAPLRVEVLGALTARGATEQAPLAASLLQDADLAVRQAALVAVAGLGGEQEVPAVVACLKAAPDDATRSQAEKTLGVLVTQAGPKCLEALLDGLSGAQPTAQVVLLQQIGALGGNRALEAVRAVAGSEDTSVQEGAFRVLAAWPDWAAASDLLRFVQDPGPPARRAVAFRGYVRLCRESQASSGERLSRVSEAARLAANASEKTLVAAALADVPDAGALKILAGYLDDPALMESAGLAAGKAALALDPSQKDAAVPVLRRVLKVCHNADAQKQAREALKRFGALSE
jgi:HEAT repeat protein